MFHYGQALELVEAAGHERPDITTRLVRFLLLAGERAQQLDTDAAVAYFRRALALAGQDELGRATALAKLAPVLEQRGDLDESIEATETAIAGLRTLICPQRPWR